MLFSFKACNESFAKNSESVIDINKPSIPFLVNH